MNPEPEPVEELWDTHAIARHLGVQYVTVRNYHQKASRERRRGVSRPGQMPPPDVTVGLRPAWHPDTIRKWLEERPGQGVGGGRKSGGVK